MVRRHGRIVFTAVRCRLPEGLGRSHRIVLSCSMPARRWSWPGRCVSGYLGNCELLQSSTSCAPYRTTGSWTEAYRRRRRRTVGWTYVRRSACPRILRLRTELTALAPGTATIATFNESLQHLSDGLADFGHEQRRGSEPAGDVERTQTSRSGCHSRYKKFDAHETDVGDAKRAAFCATATMTMAGLPLTAAPANSRAMPHCATASKTTSVSALRLSSARRSAPPSCATAAKATLRWRRTLSSALLLARCHP